MSVDKYKFVSPGVFIKEVDKSQLPAIAQQTGPVIIGRTEKGPAFRPTMVSSYDEFVKVFGEPIAGGGSSDAWREGNYSSPTYAPFAAKAYLRNNGPVTVVRLLGVADSDADGTTAALGGAGWTVPSLGDGPSDGGAYGLFMVNSSSLGDNDDTPIGVTGTLAAIWYLQNGTIALSGNTRGDATTATASNASLLESTAKHEFKVAIADSGDSNAKTYAFNFDPNSDKYIRRVFNTNPVATNTTTTNTAKQESYWLGETFEYAVNDTCTGSLQHGLILGLKNGTNQGGDFVGIDARPSESGYFIAQNLVHASGSGFEADSQPELFKVVSLDTNGDWNQRNIKISIRDLKAPKDKDVSPYGTFTLEVRKINDTDSKRQVLETYGPLDLNPNSPNYVAKVIGDRYISWNSTERRYKEYNDYPNNSQYIRVEMSENVKNSLVDKESLPFGVKGPLRFKSFTVSGSTNADNLNATSSFVSADGICNLHDGTSISTIHIGAEHTDIKFQFPGVALRTKSDVPEAYADHKKAYFGVELRQSGSSTRFDKSNVDLLRAKPGAISSFDASTTTEHMWAFTLDDLILQQDNNDKHAEYVSGSCSNSESITAISGGYQAVLDGGFTKFTTVLHGGHDGLDVTEADPFRNTLLQGKTKLNNYAYASVMRALDVISEPDELEFNLATMPGITNESLTQELADLCEDRGDALAIIDPKGGYEPIHEGAPGTYPKIGSVSDTVSNMKARDLNSSYACLYYPWVQVKAATGQLIWVPPSVVALGTMGSSESRSEVWFAPAGFNRGGLSEGSAGINVISAREKLSADDRDDLYENRVNPIASFPSEGIVIFGQKTAQIQASALDRINVRRLLIHLKKEISRISNRILFDQNVPATWNRFLGRVEPLLASVKSRFGLEDYKVILDETTTTPDLRDRNIMYAKIMLKPAKAIEFIALDFTIMRSGASFDD